MARQPTAKDAPVSVAIDTPRSEDIVAQDASTEPQEAASERTAGAELVAFKDLSTSAGTTDMLLMLAGSIGASVSGIGQPLQFVLIGDIINSLNPETLLAEHAMLDDANRVALSFVVLGMAVLVASRSPVGRSLHPIRPSVSGART